MDDDVAVGDVVAEQAHDPADVAGQRPELHRRLIALAEHAALGVEDPGAEIL